MEDWQDWMVWHTEGGLRELGGRGLKGTGLPATRLEKKRWTLKMMELNWHKMLYEQENGHSVRHVAGG
jgi:hypothetical protein